MSKDYPHQIRVYRGGVMIGYVAISDKAYDLFNQVLVRGGKLEPCVNMVDEFDLQHNKDRYEFQKVVHLELKEHSDERRA